MLMDLCWYKVILKKFLHWRKNIIFLFLGMPLLCDPGRAFFYKSSLRCGLSNQSLMQIPLDNINKSKFINLYFKDFNLINQANFNKSKNFNFFNKKNCNSLNFNSLLLTGRLGLKYNHASHYIWFSNNFETQKRC